MEKRLHLAALKRFFAIVLCAAISVTYLPFIGASSSKAYAESNDWQDEVKAITFKPADSGQRTVYKVIDAEEMDRYDEGGDPTGEKYLWYSVPFKDGDEVEVTLEDESTRTIRYNETEREWFVNGAVLDEAVPYFDLDSQEEQEWQIGNTYDVPVVCGRHYDEDQDEWIYPVSKESVSVTVKESPVNKIEFTPSPERAERNYTEADIIMTENRYEGKYEYYSGNVPGDKLAVTWEDNNTTVYTLDEDSWDWLDSDGNKLEDVFPNYYVEGPVCVMDEQFSLNGASSGTITYTIKYIDKTTEYVVEVEGSSKEEVAVARAKANAREELYELDNNIDRDKYRPAQRAELEKAFEKAFDAIWDATTEAQVNAALAAAKKAIGAVKTDAQLKAEEAEAKKAADELKEWTGTVSKAVPAVKSAKFKAAKKKVTVSWKKATKKNLKKFDKVEIQVCKDKKFQKANTKRVEVKKSKKSATVKGLKKGTYYVRVRNVKGSGVNKQVSKWSKVKKVKIKK